MWASYRPMALPQFLFVAAIVAMYWLGFAAAQEAPIGTQIYICLTAEAKGELDELRKEISHIEYMLSERYEKDEESVRDAIKSGHSDEISDYTYMRYYGHDWSTVPESGDTRFDDPPALLKTITETIKYNKDRLEQLKKRRDDLLDLPRCAPEPVKGAAPPPPVTPPKVAPVPVTPPVAEVPKPAVKVCPKCRSIADQIADVDEQIASWERQDVSLHKANVNDPGIQTALKDIANRLAQLKSKRATLEAQKTECEKKCVSTTEEKKTGEKTEHGSSTREKPNEHKTTDKKKGRKKKDDTAHETGVGLPTGISIGIGIGGGRREERGNDRKLRSNEGGRQDGGGGFGTGGGGVFGR